MGESKQVLLSLMDATPKERLEAAIQRFLENGKSQDVASEIQVNNAGSQTRAVELLYWLDYQSGIQSVGNEYYIGLDNGKEFMNYHVDTTKRMYDIEFDYKHRVIKHLIFYIPEGYRVTSLPPNLHVDKEGYRLKITYEQFADRIIYHKEITIKDVLLRKAHFEEWNNDIARLRKAYMEQLVITR